MGIFYQMGRMVGPKVRKGKWIWRSLTGTEEEMIAAEHEVGPDLADEVRRQAPVDPDTALQRKLQAIGGRLTDRLTDKRRTWRFEIVSAREPNAFALPGGYIFVTRPLLELCRCDPDEVAFILSHEMAHIVRRHAMERIMADSALQFASRVSPVRGAASGWLRRVGIQFLASAYSRDREEESDEFAVRLVRAAGYDPAGGERLFFRLATHVGEQGQSSLGQYFATHPPFAERIARLRRKIAGTAAPPSSPAAVRKRKRPPSR